MTVTMYGIRNCTTIKKARAWLDARTVGYTFHDYKAAGIDRERLERWCREHGWTTVCNRSGTTFRKLPPAKQADLDRRRAIALMIDHPSLIRRPILEVDGAVVVGFSPEDYAAALGIGLSTRATAEARASTSRRRPGPEHNAANGSRIPRQHL